MFLSGLETAPPIECYVFQVNDTDFSYILAETLLRLSLHDGISPAWLHLPTWFSTSAELSSSGVGTAKQLIYTQIHACKSKIINYFLAFPHETTFWFTTTSYCYSFWSTGHERQTDRQWIIYRQITFNNHFVCSNLQNYFQKQ